MNRIALFLVALACAVAAPIATASAAKMPSFTNRTVTVKIAGSQKTTWQAAPYSDPGCQGELGGFRGSGTETIEWSQSRAIKAQLVGSGPSWGLTVLDKKNMPVSGLPISGSVQRSGEGNSVVCGEERQPTIAGCLGKRNFTTDAQLAFLTGKRFTLDDRNVTLTNDLYPGCDWVWDNMTVRTGAVLLNVGVGKFDPKRLAKTRSSVSLRTHEEKRCENEGGYEGSQCLTVTDWTITFYPFKKKGR